MKQKPKSQFARLTLTRQRTIERSIYFMSSHELEKTNDSRFFLPGKAADHERLAKAIIEFTLKHCLSDEYIVFNGQSC